MLNATPMIFAEYGTKRRLLLMVESGVSNLFIMGYIAEKLGGNWIRVQELEAFDGIVFEATTQYKGFEPEATNPTQDYCGNILKV